MYTLSTPARWPARDLKIDDVPKYRPCVECVNLKLWREQQNSLASGRNERRALTLGKAGQIL